MPARVKDFIQISDYTSLETLIRYLQTIRANLPADCEPTLAMRGDDTSGRRLTITFSRELTADEAALDARHHGVTLAEPDASIEELRRKLDAVPYHEAPSAKATK